MYLKGRLIAENRFAARALSAIFAEEAVAVDAAELGVQSERAILLVSVTTLQW
ncbi:MAG: hypothetical protein OXJ55_13830 [Caldilineaceae bacterium]|nr:hypothetical protein [Caldilineaceae bacterium]